MTELSTAGRAAGRVRSTAYRSPHRRRWSRNASKATALALAGALIVPVGAGAQVPKREIGEPPPVAPYRLTEHDPLGELVAEALRNNAGMAAERLAEARAAAEVRQARGRYLPTLDVTMRYSEQEGALNLGDFVNPAYEALNGLTGSDRYPTDLDLTLPLSHESRLRLAQPVFDARIVAGHAAARHRHEAQRERRSAAARRLAADVQLSYLDVASARSAARILEAALERVRENERVVQRLVEAGEATPEALYRARAERTDVLQQLSEALERSDAAAGALNQVLGRSLDEPVAVLPDSLLVRELDMSEEELLASALARREELGQLRAGARAADAGVRLATASFLPSVAVALDYGVQGQEFAFGRDRDFFVASVIASWNLFNGGRDMADRDAARADAERLRAERRDVEERVRLEVRQAYDAAVVARTAIATAEDRLAAAHRTFELVRRRYEEGVAPHIEFVAARAALTSAELNRSLTLYRYAARTVDLERAAALRAID